jgi:hypothetical protein
MTQPNDFWSDPEMFSSGDFVKFDAVGDTVSGTITGVRKHMFEDGKVVPQIELDTADGPKTLTAGQVRLKAALAEKRPGVGDLLTVTLTGIEKRAGGKTLKEFSVVVGPFAAPTAPVAAAAAPAAAADPLAGISPEAIAAIKGLL